MASAFGVESAPRLTCSEAHPASPMARFRRYDISKAEYLEFFYFFIDPLKDLADFGLCMAKNIGAHSVSCKIRVSEFLCHWFSVRISVRHVAMFSFVLILVAAPMASGEDLSYRDWVDIPDLSAPQRDPRTDIFGSGVANALKYILGYGPKDTVPSEVLPQQEVQNLDGIPHLVLDVGRDPRAVDGNLSLQYSYELNDWYMEGEKVAVIEDTPQRFTSGVRIDGAQSLFSRLRTEVDYEPIPWEAEDGFEREETAFVNGEDVDNIIGKRWRSGVSTGAWRTVNGSLELRKGPGLAIIYQHNVPTAGWNESVGFTLEGTVQLNSNSSMEWAGVVANYSPDATDGPAGVILWYNGAGDVQIIEPNGQVIQEVDQAFQPVPNATYRLTMRFIGDDAYDFLILDTATEKFVFSALAVQVPKIQPRLEGFAGFAGRNANAHFDELTLLLHAWQKSFALESDEGWTTLGSGAFMESLGDFKPLKGATFWAPDGTSGPAGLWIPLGHIGAPGKLTVSYFVANPVGREWSPGAGGHLWVDASGAGWDWAHRIGAVKQLHEMPEAGWTQWTESYTIDSSSTTIDGVLVSGKPLGFAFHLPVLEQGNADWSPLFDRFHVAFTPAAQQSDAIFEAVESTGDWTGTLPEQFVSSESGLNPKSGENFWSISGATGSRQPRKIFTETLRPGYWIVSYNVGKLDGYDLPSLDDSFPGPKINTSFWADLDDTGAKLWTRRLLPQMSIRPEPQEGWELWTDIYTVTDETKTAGGGSEAPAPVVGIPFGFAFRPLDLQPGFGIAFDNLRIEHREFSGRVDPRKDPLWLEGFDLMDPDPSDGGQVVETLDFGKPETMPRWTLAEWWTKYPLEGTSPKILRPDGVGYANAAKEVILTPDGNPDAGLILTVNANVEYDSIAPYPGQPWPHLFVSQRLYHDASLSLDKLEAVEISANLRLNNFEAFDTDGAAQYLIYFTIQNLNRGSSDYGNYFWFGLRYDNRYEFPDLYIAVDVGGDKEGTNKLMYNPAMEAFVNRSINSGEWTTLRGNLLPHIVDGFTEAVDRGSIAADSKLSDYYVASMTIGWEVPGLYNVSMQMRDLELDLIRKPTGDNPQN